MSAMASQITSLTIVYSSVYSNRRSKKTSKIRITGLGERNSLVTGEFPAQRSSNAENVSIWWHHHAHWTPGYSCHSHPHQTLEPLNIFISSGHWSYSWHPQMLPNPGVILASWGATLDILFQQKVKPFWLCWTNRSHMFEWLGQWFFSNTFQ